MPRERITDKENPTFDVVVAWGRDHGAVQIATEVNDWYARLPGIAAEYFTTTTSTATGGTITMTPIATHIADQPAPVPHGWYVNLDRYQVNELIRILRRARDQAFGRDE